MSKKNILVVCPTQIYPIEMGTQVRFLNLIKGLSKDHFVDVIAKVPSRAYFNSIFADKVKVICNDYYPVLAPNKKSRLSRIYYRMKHKLNKDMRTVPNLLYYNSIPVLEQKIAQIANSKRYNIINCEYWYSCSFLNRLSYKPYLALDTINVNYEKFKKTLEVNKEIKPSNRKLKDYKKWELKYTGLHDLIISVSEHDYEFFKYNFPDKTHIKIPIGQDLNRYLNYKSDKIVQNRILFFGNMSKNSIQNMDAFWTLYHRIYPEIKKRFKNCQLFVVGANPPKDIRKLNGDDVIVTGFVGDIIQTISQASVFILPLKTGGGFRTRVVEVMASGIPVIGTHNALDSVELKHGVHGYITDRIDEMVEYGIRLLRDNSLRQKMGETCRKFVSEKYSMEATYGKLSQYYLNLPKET